MAVTGSDICKVRDLTYIHNNFNRNLQSLQIMFVHSCQVTSFCSLTLIFSCAVFIPPVGVFLERGCHADLVCHRIHIFLKFVGTYPIFTVYKHPVGMCSFFGTYHV